MTHKLDSASANNWMGSWLLGLVLDTTHAGERPIIVSPTRIFHPSLALVVAFVARESRFLEQDDVDAL
jgi:hypothetical protein